MTQDDLGDRVTQILNTARSLQTNAEVAESARKRAEALVEVREYVDGHLQSGLLQGNPLQEKSQQDNFPFIAQTVEYIAGILGIGHEYVERALAIYSPPQIVRAITNLGAKFDLSVLASAIFSELNSRVKQYLDAIENNPPRRRKIVSAYSRETTATIDTDILPFVRSKFSNSTLNSYLRETIAQFSIGNVDNRYVLNILVYKGLPGEDIDRDALLETAVLFAKDIIKPYQDIGVEIEICPTFGRLKPQNGFRIVFARELAKYVMGNKRIYIEHHKNSNSNSTEFYSIETVENPERTWLRRKPRIRYEEARTRLGDVMFDWYGKDETRQIRVEIKDRQFLPVCEKALYALLPYYGIPRDKAEIVAQFDPLST